MTTRLVSDRLSSFSVIMTLTLALESSSRRVFGSICLSWLTCTSATSVNVCSASIRVSWSSFASFRCSPCRGPQ
jgi:hypothetical protein